MRLRYLLFFSFFTGFLFSQSGIQNSPQLVSSAGESWEQGGYKLSCSLGEIAIETFIQSNNILTQGFHQEEYQVSTINYYGDSQDIICYPNPTSQIININFKTEKKASIVLLDIRGGRLLSLKELKGNTTHQIDLTNFAEGVYYIEVLLGANSKKVYQIQKFN